ncbi:MAG: VCBS repeat-containing protein [bacterium]|nr:VCBS repeat-containing protein [bacterium]
MKTFLTPTALLLLALLTPPAAAQIQPLNAWWTDTGETDSTELGYSLASLGDVNGDGFDDFCSGSWQNTIYIYYGSAAPDSECVYAFHPPGDSISNFSYNMSNIGDVNGDGAVDLLIQGHGINRNAHYYCFLYFGGAVFDTIPDLVLDGGIGNPNSNFGRSASAAGDFNGDGGQDFIIADPEIEIQQYPVIMGKIYLYFGGELLDSIPDLIMTADQQFDYVGGEVCALGDINEDGFDDILTANWGCSGPGGAASGAIMLFFFGGGGSLTSFRIGFSTAIQRMPSWE